MVSKELILLFTRMANYVDMTQTTTAFSPEDIVYYLSKKETNFKNAFEECGGDFEEFLDLLEDVSALDFERNNSTNMVGMKSVYADNELTNCLNVAVQSTRYTHKEQIGLMELLETFYTTRCDVCKYFNMSGIEDYVDFIDAYRKKIGDNGSFADDFKEETSYTESGPNPFGSFMGAPMKLENYCTDLLEVAKNHDEPLIGREVEVDKTLRVLCRKTKNNVIHLGEAGVGKTAITMGIAKAILEDRVPEKIKGHQLYSLDVGSLMAGTQYRGDLEKRLKFVIKELDKKENVILYIDEIHMIMGGSSDGTLNMANLIKTALLETSIKFIGATTYKEYKNCIEKDNAFARRFKTIDVVEPTMSDTKEIIKGIIDYYSEYHNCKYTDDAIDSAVELSVKYVHDKFLPDKAIDLIDEAGAYLSKNDTKDGVVDKSLIELIVSESYNIPKETVTKEDKHLIFELEDALKREVFGQDEAIRECVKAIKLSRAGLTDGNKPVASLLFVGQTGVGKTEIARQLADKLNIDFVKFDMSEYMEQTSVNKLIGASAGYVGYEDGGLLVDTIRKKPNCVLLLDEIEKAHPSVFNVLLQVMDDAKLTDNKGRVADFKNVILIMTSNAGASGIMHKGLGFGQENTVDFSKMDKAVEQTFTPEFRNRLTKIIVLNSMNEDMAKKIANKQLNALVTIMENKGVRMTFTPSVVDYCVKHGITKEYGARPILRVINDDIKMLLVDDMLEGNLTACKLTIKDDKVLCNK